ncbi:GreA/GreB family elongation factor [Gillisia sp. M10.2A]|uniref:GreA/GreB family elongation factor n=1 Tax=Gillisia lutea TaxID=2909668 RepID=A0ABS9EFB0_9FLAO|nr:GreA/GreB family elongation factor [Gillisia lutea]MCF4101531.1 GreA/GreB family elongation factor [Gillisia lutea]
MSRGFVKEDDQEEAPFIPPRAALPVGVINYVTPLGYKKLIDEKKELEQQRANLDITDDKERRHALAVLDGTINLLQDRINSSRILKPEEQPQDEVRFGATVSFKNLDDKKTLKFQLVGVDEANIKDQKIAFVAPIAKALTGKKVGEKTQAFMAGKQQELEILMIEY